MLFIKSLLRSKPGSVTVVALLLLIPLALIESKIRERGHYHDAAVTEISNSWTRAQTIVGPIIVVEYQLSETVNYWSKQEGKTRKISIGP